jgi:LysM repeat protein
MNRDSSLETYTVEGGDCLWKIARAHGVSLRSLVAANPQLANPDQIQPGEQVTIPNPFAEQTGNSLKNIVARAKSALAGAFDKLSGPESGRMEELLRLATAQVGTLESGNNSGAITRFTAGKTGWPWCARFVSWCYRQAGMPLPGGDQWAVASIKSIIKSLGQWHDARHLEPGMVCTFRSCSHVEIVAKPVYKNGALSGYMTIGADSTQPGSSRQGVTCKQRSLSELEGGGFPVSV